MKSFTTSIDNEPDAYAADFKLGENSTIDKQMSDLKKKIGKQKNCSRLFIFQKSFNLKKIFFRISQQRSHKKRRDQETAHDGGKATAWTARSNDYDSNKV